MVEPLTIQLNGQSRTFETLAEGTDLASLVDLLGLKPDRIAVELDGQIVPRGTFVAARVKNGARLEIVHFVGGG